MFVLIASVSLLHVDLGDEEHIDECPDEPEDAAPNDDEEFCIECEWTTTGSTCSGLEMSFEVVSPEYHVVVETKNLYRAFAK